MFRFSLLSKEQKVLVKARRTFSCDPTHRATVAPGTQRLFVLPPLLRKAAYLSLNPLKTAALRADSHSKNTLPRMQDACYPTTPHPRRGRHPMPKNRHRMRDYMRAGTRNQRTSAAVNAQVRKWTAANSATKFPRVKDATCAVVKLRMNSQARE
jgi:hypothetical protein